MILAVPDLIDAASHTQVVETVPVSCVGTSAPARDGIVFLSPRATRTIHIGQSESQQYLPRSTCWAVTCIGASVIRGVVRTVIANGAKEE